jgi:hypothetical protein
VLVVVAATAVAVVTGSAAQAEQYASVPASTSLATVRDHVVVDQLIGAPQLGADLSVLAPTRAFRLDVRGTGGVAVRTAVAATDPDGGTRPVAAKGSSVLLIDGSGHLVRNSTTGRRLTTWSTSYTAVDADLNTGRGTVAVLLQSGTAVALVRGSLGSTTLRTVRTWTRTVNGYFGGASLALAPDGISTYVAVRTSSGTTVLGVNLLTGVQRTIRVFANRVQSIDVSPDGRWLVLSWTADVAGATQALSLVPASGGGGLYGRIVPGDRSAGVAGHGPLDVAFSADGKRLFLVYTWVATPGLELVWHPGALMQTTVTTVGSAHVVDATTVAGSGLAVLRP